ncbi:hypothetical protein ZWY2020_058230 [Hordeum vulgare]|nr:hypothetical protein ZWY2020_058230 [Hordeum vulgare]
MVPTPHASPPVAAEHTIITTNSLHEHDDNLLPGLSSVMRLVGVFAEKKHKDERVPHFYAGIASFNPIIATAVNHTDMCLTHLNGALRWRLRNSRNGRLLLNGLLAGSLLSTRRTTASPSLSSHRIRTGATPTVPRCPAPRHLPIEHQRELLLAELHRSLLHRPKHRAAEPHRPHPHRNASLHHRHPHHPPEPASPSLAEPAPLHRKLAPGSPRPLFPPPVLLRRSPPRPGAVEGEWEYFPPVSVERELE